MSRLLAFMIVLSVAGTGAIVATGVARAEPDGGAGAAGVAPPSSRQADATGRPPGVTGLFTDPRPRAPDATRVLGEPPPSPFGAWDGVSTVVYDVHARTETDLGPGEIGGFSPDSARMLWTSSPAQPGEPSEVRLLDLATMTWHAIGAGRAQRWLDNDRIVYFEPSGNRRIVLNLRTDERREVGPREAPDFPDPVTPDGFVLRATPLGAEPYPFLRNRFEVLEPDGASGRIVLSFEAYLAKPAGSGELVVATPPRDGTTNIFIVAIATGQATFIATSGYTAPNWPLAADGARVVWTDGYCGIPPGRTRIYDRRSGALVELDRSDWVEGLTPDGLIAASPFGFGARWLLDPATLAYRITMPARAPDARSGSAGDVSWSPDYRYASHGFAGGHGGLCG